MSGTWAVVVNWNGGEDNVACVRSLLAQGMPAEHVVFVDNASTDGSLERVTAEFPGLAVLRNETNVGYGDGTNRGIEHALARDATRVFLVNNDLLLPAGTLVALEAALQPPTGIVGPRVVYRDEPERVWAAGGRMTYRQNLSTLIGHRRPDGPEFRRSLDVDYVPGCAMLVRREVFERVGLLEGDYFAYHEDVEFCLKAREAGFGVTMVGEVLALHAAHQATGGGYNPRRKYMMGLNTVRFLRRHGTPGRWLSFLVFDVLTLPVAFVWRGLRGEAAGVLAKGRGMLDGFRGKRVEGVARVEGDRG